MYAIIADSGKQFRVTTGDIILIDREITPDLKSVTFDRVLLVGGGEGGAKVGQPTVAGATVTADVIGPASGPKVRIFKYRRRKGYRRRAGHRQHYAKVKVTAINA